MELHSAIWQWFCNVPGLGYLIFYGLGGLFAANLILRKRTEGREYPGWRVIYIALVFICSYVIFVSHVHPNNFSPEKSIFAAWSAGIGFKMMFEGFLVYLAGWGVLSSLFGIARLLAHFNKRSAVRA